MLALRDVTVKAGGRYLLSDVSLCLRPGELHAVVGPNGAGKTTLLRVASGELKPARGEVTLDALPLAVLPAVELARRRAVLPQHSTVPFPFTVEEVVLLGRHPHVDNRKERARDHAAAEEAMQLTDVAELRARRYETLSGGEQQRVQLARVLAQLDLDGGGDTGRYLLLDEPTASLDLQHQHAVLSLCRRLRARGIATLAILHDLGLAALYADELHVLCAGRSVVTGSPATVLTPQLVESVFRVAVEVIHPRNGGRPWIMPLADGQTDDSAPTAIGATRASIQKVQGERSS